MACEWAGLQGRWPPPLNRFPHTRTLQNPEEFKAMLKATNPTQAAEINDGMIKGTLIQLSKQAMFRGHADARDGLDLDGLILSYTKIPGNDVDKDAITLGWATKEELEAATPAE